MSSFFPENTPDEYICGLFLDLVKSAPEFNSLFYVDGIVIAIGHKKYCKLLTGQDRQLLLTLMKETPLFEADYSNGFEWSALRDLMVLRKSVLPGELAQPGPEFETVRKSYPEVNPNLVTLLLKALEVLRKHQSLAMSSC